MQSIERHQSKKRGRTKTVGDYKIYLEEVLGEGSFGTVYRGKNMKTKDDVAIKAIKVNGLQEDESLLAELYNEIFNMMSINSPFVVKCLDGLLTKRQEKNNKRYYIVLEYCKRSLRDVITQQNGIFQEQQVLSIMKTFLLGYFQLFIKGIVHRDIKPENILFANGCCKISDFGSSQRCKKDTKLSKKAGTRVYQSPQILNGDKYNDKCDVWAFGIILYEMLYGEIPTRMDSFETNITRKIQNIKIPPAINKNPNVSKQLVQILEKCLKKKQEERIGWFDLLSAPIFKTEINLQFNKLDTKKKYLTTAIRTQILFKEIDIQKFFPKIKNGKGQYHQEMAMKDFFHLVSHIIPSAKLNSEEVAYTFHSFDLNKNGKISKAEFLQELKNEIYRDILSPEEKKKLSLKQAGIQKIIGEMLKEKLKIYEQQTSSLYQLQRKKSCNDQILEIGHFLCPTLKQEQILALFQQLDSQTQQKLTPQHFQQLLLKQIDLKK